MHLESIDHVQLAMPPGAEDEARKFYVGFLGLHEVPKPANLAVRGGAWFESEHVAIHLGVEKDFRPARKAHVAFLVSDVGAMARAARSAASRSSTTSPSKASIASTSMTRLEIDSR